MVAFRLFAEGRRAVLYKCSCGGVNHDFFGTCVDTGAALVTPQACDTAVVGVADAAHDLHCVVDDLKCGLAGVALEQGSVNAELLTVLLLPCAAKQHVVHVVALDLHVAQLLLDNLEVTDVLAELLAGACVCKGVVVCAHCHTDIGDAGEQSLGLEVLHQLVEALALNADEVGFVELDMVKINFAGGHAVAADLVEDGDLDAGCVQRNEVPRHILVRVLVFVLTGDAHHVLILGESGTGKELFAQSIHNASARRGRPFVSLNCAAMPRELIDSELFGYVEGAFTGARKSGSPGKIELADGGTLFLDEIGDMPLDLQVHLLKVLEDRQVTRLGDTKPRKVDVRIVVATNQNLQSLVEQGKFRLDLYYRINVFTIRLPALRDRKEDIPDLAYCFLSQCSKAMGKNVTYISQNVLQAFKAYDWPGNLRELRNAVEYGVNLAAAQKITINDIPDNIAWLAQDAEAEIDEPEPDDEGIFGAAMSEADTETRQIIELLDKYKGNKSKVANELGMSRPALYRRLKKLNIDVD